MSQKANAPGLYQPGTNGERAKERKSQDAKEPEDEKKVGGGGAKRQRGEKAIIHV